jgi:hypothetical protein
LPSIQIDNRTSISDTECEEYNGRQIDTVMSINYGAENLGLMLLPREDGWFMPDLATVLDQLNMGANPSLKLGQPEAYWSAVTDTIDAFCQSSKTPIDPLLLTGDHVMEAQFLAVIERVFHSNTRIRKEEYQRQPADHVFAASRAAAKKARYGMMTNCDACIWQEACPPGGKLALNDHYRSTHPAALDKSSR